MDRARSDYMGMLGTVMNSLALQDFLEQEGVADPRADRDRDGPGRRALHPAARPPASGEGPRGHLRRRHGLPYFSTDTTAAQRALEIGADVVLMAKAVDGVFTADPVHDATATMFTEITHREVIERGLQVADATAFSLCMDNAMPMLVFNLLTEGNIARAVSGEKIGTLV